MRVVGKDVFFRAKNGRQIQKIEKALYEYYRFIKEYISNATEAFIFEENKVDEANICGTETIVSKMGSDTHEEGFPGVDFERYKIILSENYKKGFRLNDKLSLRRFRMQWQCTFEDELQYEDETVCKHIDHITIQHGDMAYLPENMLDEDTKHKLLAYINALFSEGKSAIYYEAICREFADDFAVGRINNAEMLKTYLSYVNDGSMYLRRNYIASGSNVEVDNADEVRSFLIKQGMPVQNKDIISSLPHIGKDKILQVIAGPNSDEFVRNQKFVTPEILDRTITDDAKLVSVMMVNNEIGTIQPIKKLCEIAHQYGAIFHTDAVQAAGHICIDVKDLNVDMLSCSAHKFNGPKGLDFSI